METFQHETQHSVELLLPRAHFTARGSIHKHISLAKSRLRAQHCTGVTFVTDTFRGQRWHSPTQSNWQTGESSTICTGITELPNACGDQKRYSQTHLYMATPRQLSSKLLRWQVRFCDESKSTSLRWCTNAQKRRTTTCHVQALRWDFQSHGRNV